MCTAHLQTYSECKTHKGVDCDGIWHRDSLLPKQDYKDMRDDDKFIFPMCRYHACLVSDDDVCE